MKLSDILFIICAIILLVISYFVDNLELKSLISFCAIMCGGLFGARIGVRIYKKNNDEKKK